MGLDSVDHLPTVVKRRELIDQIELREACSEPQVVYQDTSSDRHHVVVEEVVSEWFFRHFWMMHVPGTGLW